MLNGEFEAMNKRTDILHLSIPCDMGRGERSKQNVSKGHVKPGQAETTGECRGNGARSKYGR